MGARKREFTKEQLEWLKENYKSKSMAQMEGYLGASSRVVHRLLREMGLQKIARKTEIKNQLEKSNPNPSFETLKNKANDTGKCLGKKVLGIYPHFCLVQHKNGYRECFAWSDIGMKEMG